MADQATFQGVSPTPVVRQGLLDADAPVAFEVAEVDTVADLHGDPTTAQLVVFMNGNQWMVLPDLLASFAGDHPDVGEVFVETLPPGVLVQQVRAGGLQMGSLRLGMPADVITAAPHTLTQLHQQGLCGPPVAYASNDLALLVAPDNPRNITGWADLAREDVRVAMPDPRIEGVGVLIAEALDKVGPGLRAQVMHHKRETGTTVYTRIHHRQSPRWLQEGRVDVAPLWRTEAVHADLLSPDRADTQVITLPAVHNVTGHYAAAVVTAGRHQHTAQLFIAHLTSTAGRAVYAAHGFQSAVTC